MILLDTNSLLWVLTDDSRLGVVARATLTSTATFSSPISVVEVRMKLMLGRLDVPADFVDAVRAAGVQELAFTDHHADRLAAFPQLARHDPFDRMLLAHAASSGMTLLTSDRVLLESATSFTQDAAV